MEKAVILLALSIGQVDLSEAAYADARSIPPDLVEQARYLYLDEFPLQLRPKIHRILSGHANALSIETMIQQVYVVPKTEGALVRVMIDDYGWKRGTFERLANVDPWDHFTIENVNEPAVITSQITRVLSDSDGRKLLRKSGAAAQSGRAVGKTRAPQARPAKNAPGKGKGKRKKSSSKSIKLARILSPLSGEKIGKLAVLVNSETPLLRAAWFFNQTSAQENRRPGYYDFLGIKNQGDFYRVVGFDPKKKRRKIELREAAAPSGVNPTGTRGIAREQAEARGLWITYDFRRPLGKVNPLRVLGRDLVKNFEKEDPNDAASEEFGPLPNGFWCWFLGNNQGVRQNTAPDFAATDYESRSKDHKVHVNVSCIRCHNEAGIQPIDQWARNLIRPPLALQSPDRKIFLDLRAQYIRRLEPYIALDRLSYEHAVLEATGWTAKQFAAEYAWFWEYYEDAEVTLEWAARDLRMSPVELQLRLSSYLKETGSTDTVLSNFLHDDDNRRPINIRQWEEAFPIAVQIVKGARQ